MRTPRTLASVILLTSFLTLIPAVAAGQPVETELDSVTAEVVELRQADGLLRLAVRFTNAGPKTGPGRADSPDGLAKNRWVQVVVQKAA